MKLFNHKRGQGLPISTIIIAALGLVVLIILFAIVTGRLGIFGTKLTNVTTESCNALGGRCSTTCEGTIEIKGDCPVSTDAANPLKCCSLG